MAPVAQSPLPPVEQDQHLHWPQCHHLRPGDHVCCFIPNRNHGFPNMTPYTFYTTYAIKGGFEKTKDKSPEIVLNVKNDCIILCMSQQKQMGAPQMPGTWVPYDNLDVRRLWTLNEQQLKTHQCPVSTPTYMAWLRPEWCVKCSKTKKLSGWCVTQ